MIYTVSSCLWLQNFEGWGLNRDWIWMSADSNSVPGCPQMFSGKADPSYFLRKGTYKANKQVLFCF